MSLLQLPPETLLQIFDEIGSSFFHEDLGRLTVCRWWLEFALPVSFKRITIVPRNLAGLLVSKAAKTPSYLENSLEDLGIKLEGHLTRPYMAISQEDADASDYETLNEIHEKSLIALNKDLIKLANTAQRSRKLRILRIRTRLSLSFTPHYLGPDCYLSASTMKALLSLETLRVLVLDSCMEFLIPNEGPHVCSAIGALLPTLQILHLRMYHICPEVLRPHDSDKSLCLSVVVVNLSMLTPRSNIGGAAHSRRCMFRIGGTPQLKADIREQAEALVPRMASPKTVRILTHTLPAFKMHSFDVLTGKTMLLEENMDWDEDGEIVAEDSGSESESDISSLSDF
ncbi:hypothetical protein O1611_g4069 [Lasiodiplodia mahajangana]|uniref:Uncharacterized protein n=1 Tax=Lasiodiplodia mahajangana TaxID=1108764 RepID=A0ACC2JPY6_9PEZI|nr:hypothetical protein O1611_g4069 [Lasiodiplodia mahajangana]